MSLDISKFATGIVKGVRNTLTRNATALVTNALGNPDNVTSNSLSHFSQSLQLRPYIAIESNLVNDANAGTLVQTAMSSYAAFFILSLSIDNTIMGVSVGRMMGKYSPTRDPAKAAIDVLGDAALHVGLESYDSSAEIDNVTLAEKENLSIFPELPTSYLEVKAKQEAIEEEAEEAKIEETRETTGTIELIQDAPMVSIESVFSNGIKNLENQRKSDILSATGKDDKGEFNSVGNARFQATSNAKEINELGSLAVGKVLNVTIARGNATADVSMLLKPNLISLRTPSILNIAGTTKVPTTAYERKAAWQMGKFQSIVDLLIAKDHWEAHRKNLLTSNDGGYYEQTHRRKINNQIATMLSGEFSVGTVASTFIITEATAQRMEATVGFRLNDYRRRNRFMSETGIMTLIVYNPDYQRIFIYNHGIEDVSNISMNYLAKKSKDEKFDFDIFKMLSQGSAPIL